MPRNSIDEAIGEACRALLDRDADLFASGMANRGVPYPFAYYDAAQNSEKRFHIRVIEREIPDGFEVAVEYATGNLDRKWRSVVEAAEELNNVGKSQVLAALCAIASW